MQPKKRKKTTFPLVVRRIHGHSMLPVLPPGTLIWATTWFKQLRIGDTIIFCHDNKEKIKRIDQIKGDQLYVLGDNTYGSTDSRQFGWINESDVIAKVFWPHSPKGRSEHFRADQTSPDK